jgi:hypothetical protein
MVDSATPLPSMKMELLFKCKDMAGRGGDKEGNYDEKWYFPPGCYQLQKKIPPPALSLRNKAG